MDLSIQEYSLCYEPNTSHVLPPLNDHKTEQIVLQMAESQYYQRRETQDAYSNCAELVVYNLTAVIIINIQCTY